MSSCSKRPYSVKCREDKYDEGMCAMHHGGTMLIDKDANKVVSTAYIASTGSIFHLYVESGLATGATTSTIERQAIAFAKAFGDRSCYSFQKAFRKEMGW